MPDAPTEGKIEAVARHAMAVADYMTARLPVTSTFLEAWTEFQHASPEKERCRDLRFAS